MNQTHMGQTALHHVGSLPPSDHPDLLAIPSSAYTSVDEEQVGGLTHTQTTAAPPRSAQKPHVIVTHSPNLHLKQATGLEQTLHKARRRLDELASRLARRRTRRNRDQVQADMGTRICRAT